MELIEMEKRKLVFANFRANADSYLQYLKPAKWIVILDLKISLKPETDSHHVDTSVHIV